MRISISSLAWEPAQDSAVATMLKARQIDAIDVAPSKYFPDFAATSQAQCGEVRDRWAARGIEITGMQALMFGTTGLNLFASEDVQHQMLRHLAHVCRIGPGLGARRLVFGSPKCRDRTGLDDAATLDRARSFFRQLGDVALQHEVLICLEPNPTCYGSNFMIDAAETAGVVRATDHPAIRMQLDTGAIALSGESPADVVRLHGDLIGHVHLSEPQLVPLGTGTTDHPAMAAALQSGLAHHVACIEMLSPKDDTQLQAVSLALDVAIAHYRKV